MENAQTPLAIGERCIKIRIFTPVSRVEIANTKGNTLTHTVGGIVSSATTMENRREIS